MNKRKILKTVLAVTVIAAAAFAVYCYNVYMETKAYELCQDIIERGWEVNLEYSMLSKELKELITEEEFYSTDPKVKLSMYKKMENRILDDRRIQDFHGSTAGFNTPRVDFLDVDGKTYYVEPRVDAIHKFNKIEVRNFSFEIYEADKQMFDEEKIVYPEYTEDEILNLSDKEMIRLAAIVLLKEAQWGSKDGSEDFLQYERSVENREEAAEIAEDYFTPKNDNYSYSEIKSAEEIDGVGWRYTADYISSNPKAVPSPRNLIVFSKDFYDKGRLTAEPTAENLEKLVSCFPYENGMYDALIGCFTHENGGESKAVIYCIGIDDIKPNHCTAVLVKQTMTVDKEDKTVHWFSENSETLRKVSAMQEDIDKAVEEFVTDKKAYLLSIERRKNYAHEKNYTLP